MFSTKCFFVLGLFFFCPRHGLFLPTNHTNLHESLSMNKMATCSVARIFTNSIFSATLGNLSKLDCARLHENSIFSATLGITRTSSVLHSLARKFVKFVDEKRNSWTKKEIRWQKNLVGTKIREIRGQLKKDLWIQKANTS